MKLRPMLATLTDRAFSDPEWIYERKLDGIRALAEIGDGDARVWSRNDKDRTNTWPEIAAALAERVDADTVLDGEIVAFEGSVTSFARLQGRMQIRNADEARASGIAAYYYVFDVLRHGGEDVRDRPLRDRKSVLRDAVDWADPLRFTPHRNGAGEAYFEAACRKGWEGLIAKRADAPYVSKRSRDWLKLKCVHRQEFVIAGFTEPKGSRAGFGALLLGYHADGGLRYAGRVGTGFSDADLGHLRAHLDRLERKTSPFADGADAGGKGVHFVTPELVGEVAFTEWTGDGRLRHPRFVGLRTDKDAADVVREGP